MSETNTESDVRHLSREFIAMQQDVKALERTSMRLRYVLEGEDGNGGVKATVIEIAAQQKADSNTLRLAIWYPATISTIALIISIAGMIITLTRP